MRCLFHTKFTKLYIYYNILLLVSLIHKLKRGVPNTSFWNLTQFSGSIHSQFTHNSAYVRPTLTTFMSDEV